MTQLRDMQLFAQCGADSSPERIQKEYFRYKNKQRNTAWDLSRRYCAQELSTCAIHRTNPGSNHAKLSIMHHQLAISNVTHGARWSSRDRQNQHTPNTVCNVQILC